MQLFKVRICGGGPLERLAVRVVGLRPLVGLLARGLVGRHHLLQAALHPLSIHHLRLRLRHGGKVVSSARDLEDDLRERLRLSVGIIAFGLNGTAAIAQQAPTVDPFTIEWQFADFHPYAKGAAVSNDGRWLIASDNENSVYVWDFARNGAMRKLDSAGYIDSFAANPDGSVAAVSVRWPEGPNEQKHATHFYLRAWDTSTGNVIATVDAENVAYRLAFTRDGKSVAMKGDELRLWKVGASSTPSNVPDIGHALTLVFGSGPYAGYLLTADRGEAKGREIIRMRNTSTWNIERTFPAPCLIGSLAMSPDGRRLAAGCRDPTGPDSYPTRDAPVVIWDMASGQVTQTLRGHSMDVLTVAFTPDSRWIVSGSTAVLAWNVESGGLAWSANPCQSNWTKNLGFTGDGTKLVVNCNRFVALLRRVSEFSVQEKSRQEKLLIGKEAAANLAEKLLFGLRYVIGEAQLRRLNDLKSNPAKEADISRFRLAGAKFCGIGEYLPGGKTKALSIECVFEEQVVSREQLFELAKQAAPQLKWSLHGPRSLEYAWGQDARNELIVRIYGQPGDKRVPIEIVESR